MLGRGFGLAGAAVSPSNLAVSSSIFQGFSLASACGKTFPAGFVAKTLLIVHGSNVVNVVSTCRRSTAIAVNKVCHGWDGLGMKLA